MLSRPSFTVSTSILAMIMKRTRAQLLAASALSAGQFPSRLWFQDNRLSFRVMFIPVFLQTLLAEIALLIPLIAQRNRARVRGPIVDIFHVLGAIGLIGERVVLLLISKGLAVETDIPVVWTPREMTHRFDVHDGPVRGKVCLDFIFGVLVAMLQMLHEMVLSLEVLSGTPRLWAGEHRSGIQESSDVTLECVQFGKVFLTPTNERRLARHPVFSGMDVLVFVQFS